MKKENINSISGDGELMLYILASFAQKEMIRKCTGNDRHGSVSLFSNRINCRNCGSFHGSWYSTDKYRKVIWRCNYKYKGRGNCSTPHLEEKTIQALFIKAVNLLCDDRKELILTFEVIKAELYDTTALEAEQTQLQQEVIVVTELVE